MNKYRIINPNNKEVREYKSRTTEDGDYTVNRLGKNDRKGPYNSDLVVESRSAKIPARGGINPAYPKRKPGYLEGVFIHRSNNNGWAGVKGNQAVSKGCPLITPKDWTGFSKQLEKVNSFRLRITRN